MLTSLPGGGTGSGQAASGRAPFLLQLPPLTSCVPTRLVCGPFWILDFGIPSITAISPTLEHGIQTWTTLLSTISDLGLWTPTILSSPIQGLG
ncbi:hypothetical protein FKM82_000144 [Ascaphus truei]